MKSMTAKQAYSAALTLVLFLSVIVIPSAVQAQQAPAAPAVAIGPADIGGVVTSRFGPEAGVWVVAETIDLGTRFAKMVATDERGRYLLPDLPKASYRGWVRGYGLVDSPKV